MLANFFYVNPTYSYDLPKVKEEKNIENFKNDDTVSENEQDDTPIIDKNYIFIDEYKGLKFYLDCYSIKIKKNKIGKLSWSQFIFPIGSNVTPSNSKSLSQKFFFDGKHAYNSSHAKNMIDDIENEEDRRFLLKCFEIGYQNIYNKNNKMHKN